VRTYVEYLSLLGSRTEPGLDADSIERLERALGTRFPDEVRELYRICGGLHDKRWTGVPPMRLMRPGEVIETAEILRDSAEVYSPSPQARYLFTDDGSNWVGVFVRGPLKGKLTILDHDAPEVWPRFSGLSSFIDKLVEAGRRDDDWPDIDTDYPLRPDSDAALIADAGPLAHRYLDRYRTATIVEKAVRAATTALHLLPPAHESVLSELLRSPLQYVRYMTLEVAGLHRATALVPDILAYGQAARRRGNFAHWSRAGKALLALGALAELDALEAGADANWPTVNRRRRTDG
jgi:hypothetical protein